MSFAHQMPALEGVGVLLLHSCWLAGIAGFSAAWCVGHRQCQQSRSTWAGAQFSQYYIYSVVGILVGSRLGFVLLYGLQYWREDWLYPLEVWDGRMSFFGGLFGLIVVSENVALKQGRNTADVLDFASSLVGPGFFVGCVVPLILGAWLTLSMRVRPEADMSDALAQLHALRAALLAGCVMGSIIGLFCGRPRPRLAPFGLCLAGIGVTGFLVEFRRSSDPYSGYRLTGGLSGSQLICVTLLVVGTLLLTSAYRSRTPSGNLDRSAGVTKNG